MRRWQAPMRGFATDTSAEAMAGYSAPVELYPDCQATANSITGDVESWRTRHDALRAAVIRDLITTDGIVVEHVQGTGLIAHHCGQVHGADQMVGMA